MPADTLSREEIERRLDMTPTKDGVVMSVTFQALSAMQAAIAQWRSEPARLASAKAEGVREGIEMAARWLFDRAELIRARARASDKADWRHKEQHAADHLEIADHAIRTIFPPPAEPSAPVAPDWPTRCAALEADGIAARKRVVALEAENAKLRERNAALEDGLHPFAVECNEWIEQIHLLPDETVPEIKAPNDDAVAAAARFTLGDLRRARALLQGGPDAG